MHGIGNQRDTEDLAMFHFACFMCPVNDHDGQKRNRVEDVGMSVSWHESETKEGKCEW